MRGKIILALLFFLVAGPALALTPNDEYLSEQWYLENINAYSAWDSATGSNEVVVAVLDTGVDLDHPDLAEQIWVNSGEIADDGIDNDNNGFIDDVNGWDFVTKDNNPSPEIYRGAFDADAVSHGTFLAGIIGAASNNDEGIAGLNWQVKIMPVRILDRFGSGDSGRARRAVDYAVANGADVINFSFTGNDFDQDFFEAVQAAYEKGVVIVAAMGNDSENTNEQPVYPACFKSVDGTEDYIIGVAASDTEDGWADFSNYGSNCVDISAPGVDIFSTLFQEDEVTDLLDFYAGDWDGTSMAAPMVTGAVALLKSAFSGITPEEIKLVLQLSVDPLNEHDVKVVGQLGTGRLNLSRALELAPSFASAPVITTETTSSGLLTVGQAGGSSLVRLVDSSGNVKKEFYAFEQTFAGGVRVAMGDVNGDGYDEVIVGAGPGGGPQVRIFSTEGVVLGQFFAYESTTSYGIFVSVGDLDGDGVEEILTSPDKGGNGEVRWFNFSGEQQGSLKPVALTTISLRVAAGDTDGDGIDEIIIGTGSGSSPMVKIFEAKGTSLGQFYAYASTYDKGIYVEAGDLNNDGFDEIVTGTDYGGGPHVRVFDQEGSVISSFFAYDEAFRGGVRVAVADLDKSGFAEIYTAAGPGGGPHVRVFDKDGLVLGGFFPFSESLSDGIFIAGW